MTPDTRLLLKLKSPQSGDPCLCARLFATDGGAMAEGAQWQAKAGPYLGEISALAFLHLSKRLYSSFPLLLAGTGSQVLAYDVESRRLLCSFHAFRGVRVHGLALPGASPSSSEDVIAVYGERRVKLLRMLLGGDGREVSVGMEVYCLLPRFDHWVLDALFIEAGRCLAVGLSDNSIAVWDVVASKLLFRVKSPERCLLYSMRLWGEDVETLCIASGTIYNEIIVWKLVLQTHRSEEDCSCFSQSCCNDILLFRQHYMAIHLSTLTGHRGSIFRIAWSSDGSKLLSASDDRSARIWLVNTEKRDNGVSLMLPAAQLLNGRALFGHDARIWDCYISDSVVITAGEDCTCRIWGMDGNQIMMFKEHTGRGIWRCLYDPNTSLLITAGFDSAIQVHVLSTSLCKNAPQSDWMLKGLNYKTEIFSICIPSVSEKLGLTDSKSEYVRCLHFCLEDVLYVATNNGYLYHAKLSNPADVRWTQLAHISEEVPIICMDLMSMNLTYSSVEGDMIALGDGKGNATVVRVVNIASSPNVALSFTWVAERQRQLLGIHWCKSLGCSYVFTADPRGTLKLWRVEYASKCVADTNGANANVSPVAVFSSCFGARIVCLDASMKEQLLVCGDLRGNLVLFALSSDILISDAAKSEKALPSLTHFKGAHGISTVTSILIGRPNAHQIDLRTTGGDGCICYFNFDLNSCTLEFLGMKHVKELSIIQGLMDTSKSMEDSEQSHCAIGFASTDFIIWNLMNESKMLQIGCGGWRRPYSYYLGDVPEIQNCFAFLKDHKIHVHRLWELAFERELFPQILHIQCHGREIHSSCFISFQVQPKSHQSKNLWVATGSEDGTVRVTRYTPSNLESWSSSLLLGEHAGGSAVRSLCFISEVYTYRASQRRMPDGTSVCNSLSNNESYRFLLISVGAKQVLTSWLLRDRATGNDDESCVEGSPTGSAAGTPEREHLSMSFQWLSTHMPPKLRRMCRAPEIILGNDKSKKTSTFESAYILTPHLTETINREAKTMVTGENDNDWRYLAVTGFLVEGADCRSKVCFIVAACSDATLTLRALLLPQRLWFDVASLVSQTSPVLALQHVVVPVCEHIKCDAQFANAYIIVSGSTDGTIALWDLTKTIEQFMQSILELQLEKFVGSHRRPRTGRGSQGGRWWKSLNNYSCKKGVVDASKRTDANLHGQHELNGMQSCGNSSEPASKLDSIQNCPENTDSGQLPVPESDISVAEICELQPLHILRSVHQSGVNCLHVSTVMQYNDSRPGSVYCVLSGGDDQALSCFFFEVAPNISGSSDMQPIIDFVQNRSLSQPNHEGFAELRYIKGCCHHYVCDYELRVLHWYKVDSAHSAAVKGVWTDGNWVFSTGLDQRIRFWHLADCTKLIEHDHLIISVPEPESLDAVNYDSSQNRYQIVVTGRGMQMVEFSP